ncbi:hypothetical protein Ais01nite_01380 [Asanoa ishikariensis]|uniref:Uncharacterized protein n=1 Tax=Asanoa ishikariensis TaxID=137265 RepID=A0A1H3TQM0_9ACTN|nr:hypothetical protein [Asanoa ishikariensis]GIF62103.1 hypothetical protein Ais01nite_01380 [Asanoa ishikariensis]SDZ51629.1 hypothetical protein SAMN05421684_6084 [Asanoa ishikariensis]
MATNPGGPPPRPVAIASVFLAGAAVLGVLDVIATRLAIGNFDDAAPGALRVLLERAVDDADVWVEQMRGALNVNVVVAVGVIVVFGALAAAIRRRSPAARVAVWVAAAAAVCLLGVGIANNPEFSPTNGTDPVVEEAWSRLLPGWYSVVRSLLTAGELLTVLIPSLLLLRTSAGEFYRPQVAEPGLGAVLAAREARMARQAREEQQD